MKKSVFGLVAALGLAACGSSTASVDIDRSATVVKETLARVDGKINLEGLLTSPPVVRKTEGNTVSYLIKGRGGNEDSHIVLTVEELGPEAARLSMSLDIAEIRAELDGQEKFLSETLVRSALRSQLRTMERKLERGDPPSEASVGLDRAIAMTALATDPEQIRRAVALAKSDGYGASDWNEGAPPSWGNGDEAMARPEFQDVQGTEIVTSDVSGEFVGGDTVSGTSPEPSDW